MRRLIWGSAGRTYHIFGNPMSRLIFCLASQDSSMPSDSDFETTLIFQNPLKSGDLACKKKPLYTRSSVRLSVCHQLPKLNLWTREWQRIPITPYNHKAIGFLWNSGPDPLENHKATKATIGDGPLLVVFGPSLSSLDSLWQNSLDPRLLTQKLIGTFMRGSNNFCQGGSRPDCQKTALTTVF